MKCLSVVLVALLSLVHCMPSETTTPRSPSIYGDSIKRVTNQLMDVNSSTIEMATFDTRTPPKVKQQQKMKGSKPVEVENSHAGVAIPMDEDSIEVEEKLNSHKVERPTTNSGLSTWILLSGQTSTPTKPPKKNVIKPNVEESKPDQPQKQNVTLVVTENVNRNPKPIFKKRVTTPKPSGVNKTVSTITTTPKTTTVKDTKLTKVKATVLNSALLKKSNATNNSTDMKVVKKQPTTTQKPTTTTKILLPIVKPNTSSNAIIDSNLPMEGKEGDTDLQTSTDASKKKKTTTKRKKNKTRRRKPGGLEKSDDSNSTKIDKHKTNKEKPIGTQLYNYLSREVMPTVGVGLVGLMVTAGLASYFLYPFGVARRSYEIDRKDKEGPYYYDDEYSGGIAEEEAIGKVIAGMPATSYYTNNVYKSSTSRNTYPNMRYRNVDVRKADNSNMVRGTVESVPLTPEGFKDSYLQAAENQADSNFYQQPYKGDETQEKKFVVGSVPKEVITSDSQAADIPEHGPRSLKIRKRRSNADNETENELNSMFTENGEMNATTTPLATSTEPTTTMESLPDKYVSFFNVIKDLLHLKIRMGLQIIQNATQTLSKYVSKVQMRLDEQYKNETEGRQ